MVVGAVTSCAKTACTSSASPHVGRVGKDAHPPHSAVDSAGKGNDGGGIHGNFTGEAGKGRVGWGLLRQDPKAEDVHVRARARGEGSGRRRSA